MPPTTVTQGPGDDVGYTDKTDVVTVGGVTWIVTGESGAACIQIGAQCVPLDDIKRQNCGDVNAQVDIVMVEGKVVKVICYPPKTSGTPIEQATVNKDGQTQLPQNQSGKVIVFGAETDGKPIKGDVRLDGERVNVIGNGIDKTIIEGNLTIASNNAHVRGLTVKGNVTFEKNSNDNSIAFCKVTGNVVIDSNNITVMSNQIFGNLVVNGNGALLLTNLIGGKIEVTGSVATCEGNYAFTDANSDKIVQTTEKGALLPCPKK